MRPDRYGAGAGVGFGRAEVLLLGGRGGCHRVYQSNTIGIRWTGEPQEKHMPP